MNAVVKVKHPQAILAVDARYVDGLGVKHGLDSAISITDFIAGADQHYVIAQRNRLETDTRYRQLLPYVILGMYIDGILHIATYQRLKGVGESRLGMAHSVGFGGHIDNADVSRTPDSVIRLMDTVDIATRREMDEEIRLNIRVPNLNYTAYTVKAPLTELGVLCDRESDVGAVHVGFAQLVIIDSVFTAEIKEGEELLYKGFVSVIELADDLEESAPDKWEPWSQWCISYLSSMPARVYAQTNGRGVELTAHRNSSPRPTA